MFQMFPLLGVSLIVYAVITMTGVGDLVTSTGDILPWYEVIIVPLTLLSLIHI